MDKKTHMDKKAHQHGGVVRGRRDEAAVAAKPAVGYEHMKVRVRVGERAKGLQADDGAGGEVTLTEYGAQVVAQGAEGEPAQIAAAPAVVVDEPGGAAWGA